jgi:hypothetical protein
MSVTRFVNFASKVIISHVISYALIGAVGYQLLTKPFYEGRNPIFATFMRTPAEPGIWRHAMTWLVPGQVLRGLLIAAVLYPFYDTLIGWGWKKRFLSISGLYLVLGYWASAVAAPGTIDGMIYLRPEINAAAHLKVQPEIILQGLVSGGWVAWWMVPKSMRTAKTIKIDPRAA